MRFIVCFRDQCDTPISLHFSPLFLHTKRGILKEEQ